MAEAKTKPTQVNVEDYLNAKASPEQLIDCNALISLLERITGEAPKMWGLHVVSCGTQQSQLVLAELNGWAGRCVSLDMRK